MSAAEHAGPGGAPGESRSGWTEHRIAELTRLWPTGLSAAGIGREIGMSKNAVIGKAHRIGLPKRPSPIKRHGVKGPGRVALPKARNEQSLGRRSAAPPPAGREETEDEGPATHVSPCQWLFGDGTFTDDDKCGKPAVPGRPYCAVHCARAYVPIEKQRGRGQACTGPGSAWRGKGRAA